MEEKRVAPTPVVPASMPDPLLPKLAVSPYVGLCHYEVDEADRFFGRRAEAAAIRALAVGHRLVVVSGPAGIGTSSLLRAGVVADFDPAEVDLLPISRLGLPAPPPGDNPLISALLTAWAHTLDPQGPRALSLSDLLLARTGHPRDHRPLVAVVDQFEAAFTGSDLHRDELIDQLVRAVADVGRLHLVLVLHTEARRDLEPYEAALSDGDVQHVTVGRLSPDAALEAVTGPSALAGRSFAPGVAEALVDQLRTTTLTDAFREQRSVVAAGVEPAALQMVCSALWARLPADATVVTAHDVDSEALLTGIVAEAVADVAAVENLRVPLLWEWLETTFVTDLGTRDTAYEGVTTTRGLPNTVARAFEARRILRAERRSGSVWFELLFDGLIEPIRRGRRLAGDGQPSVPAGRSADDYLRLAEGALEHNTLGLAAEYARRSAASSLDDPHTLAEARKLLGNVLVEQAQSLSGVRADNLLLTAKAHYQVAAQLFEAEQDLPAVARVLTAMARLSRLRGKFAEALEALQGALARLEDDPELHLELARAVTGSGQPQAAISHYDTVLQLAPKRVEALLGRGSLHAGLGHYTAALDDLDKAIQLQPELADRGDVAAARRLALQRRDPSG